MEALGTMDAFFKYLHEDLNLLETLLKILLAVIFGGYIGMERGKQGRAAGMRTHILVCLGATLTAMTGIYMFELTGAGDPLRVAAQVISGIGFLGVGTILIKGRFQITGLTTAAGLWAAATIGIALGTGFFVGAIAAFVATLLTMSFLHRFEYRVTHKNTRFGIYLEINCTDHIRKIQDHLRTYYNVADIQVTPPRSGVTGNMGIEAVVFAYVENRKKRFGKNKPEDAESAKEVTEHIPGVCDRHNLNPQTMSKALEELPEVLFSIESI